MLEFNNQDGHFSDSEDFETSLNMIKLERRPSQYRDDSEVGLASPSNLKLRGLLQSKLGCITLEKLTVIDEDNSDCTPHHRQQRVMSTFDEELMSKKIQVNEVDSEKNTLETDSMNNQTINDGASAGGFTLFGEPEAVAELTDESAEVYGSEERLMTEAERSSFYAPLPINAPEFKPSPAFSATQAREFVPRYAQLPQMNYTHSEQEQFSEHQHTQNCNNYAPSYKQKEKTEICKFWTKGQYCPFGDSCAFAHGEEQLQKKTHVASKFRMTLCKSYLKAPYVCQYGSRCQFCHLERDFSDFDSQRTPYQNLLTENVKIMESRIAQVADPDISQFNIAMPEKSRLSIFSQIAPDTAPASKQKAKKTSTDKKEAGQKKQRNTKIDRKNSDEH